MNKLHLIDSVQPPLNFDNYRYKRGFRISGSRIVVPQTSCGMHSLISNSHIFQYFSKAVWGDGCTY